MIGFDISILVISNKLPKYTKKDLELQIYSDVTCSAKLFTLNKLDSYDDFLHFLNEHKTIDYIATDINTDKKTIDILTYSSVEFTKKWGNYAKKFDIHTIINGAIETIKCNLNRKISNILFSVYTPTYNTPKEMLDTAYNSLRRQTYQHWNWYVLDDSPDDKVCNMLKAYNDPRICVIKNVSNHANIGFNKHNIAMICNGDWLVELDHDDELTDDCLLTLYRAIVAFPESKFIYSDAVEEAMKYGKMYGEEYEFCHYLGRYKTEVINGQSYTAAYVGELNPVAIRSILAAPNHIRCFERNFYHKINGHSTDMAILDDMELMSRAFLNIDSINEITYIPHILYLQHNENTTARSHTNITLTYDFMLVEHKYDKLIHEKLLSLNLPDPAWNEEYECSYFNKKTIDAVRDKLPVLCNTYNG